MKYLKSLLYFFAPLVILFLISTTLNYFNVMPNNMMKYCNLAIIFISALSASIFVGRRSGSKGYLEGLKVGLMLIIILFVFSYLAFDKGINLERILLYCIVMVTCITGSIIGINKKKV